MCMIKCRIAFLFGINFVLMLQFARFFYIPTIEQKIQIGETMEFFFTEFRYFGLVRKLGSSNVKQRMLKTKTVHF